MDKPVMVVAVFYLVGLAGGTAFSYFPCLVLLLVAVGIGIAVHLVRKGGLSKSSLVMMGSVFLAGMVTLQMAVRSSSTNHLNELTAQDRVAVKGRIVAPLKHRSGRKDADNSTALLMDVKTALIDGKEQGMGGRLRLTVRGFYPEVQYGDEILAKTHLRTASGFRNPGGFDYAGYLKQQGIEALASLHRPEDLVRIGPGGNPILRKIFDWREQIRLAMISSLSPEASAILQAMIIGESGSLTPEIREAFMASGTTHLLSISGSHLSLVAMVVFTSIWWTINHLPAGLLLRLGRRTKPSQVAAMVTLLPVVFYALLAGGQIATIRSLIMILVYLGSLGLMREHDPLHALAIAAILVTAWDPQAIFDISFQLSYGAVLAMALIAKKGYGIQRAGETTRLAIFWIKVKTVLLLTAVAGLSTAPLVAFHFNQFSWVGFVSNLIVVPLVGIVVVPLGLIGAIHLIAASSSAFPLAGPLDGLIRLLMVIVKTFARLPGAELHCPSPPIGVIALWYAAGGITFFSRAPYLKRIAMAALCLIFTLPWVMGIIKPDRFLRLTFLDVGQGDAALIQFPDGKTLLIDGGGRYGDFDVGRLAVAPYLWDRSISKIDYLVATHPQADHVGGLIYVLRKFRAGEVWTNGVPKESDFFSDFIRATEQQGLTLRTVHKEDPPLKIGEATVSVMHPGPASSHLKDNNLSLVIKIQYGRHSFLFTGDIEDPAERELLRWGERLKSSVLKVPHHGSRSSIEPEFLARVCPRIAVISSGASNPYGHPAPETLAAYRLLQSRLYRTDRDGAVIIVTDGQRLKVATDADFRLARVRWGRGMLSAELENGRKTASRWVSADPS